MKLLEPPKTKYLMIVDLEATCCNKETIPRDRMEIIEIGAVMVDVTTLEVVDEFQTFVSPVINHTLTEFCKRLTTITQKEVDYAPAFLMAMMGFEDWLAGYPDYTFCSWGYYDKNQFLQDHTYHNLRYKLPDNHVNIKVMFSTAQGVKKKFGVMAALRRVNLMFLGTQHRGIDDAKNMARLLPFIFKPKEDTNDGN